MKPKIVFSDFDGTLTLGEDLTPTFFKILDLLSKNNIDLIPVSGRSLSWGHFLLTHLNFKYAIMEGGGVMTYKDKLGFIRNHYLVTNDEIKNLEQFSKSLIKKFLGLELTADSLGRVTDQAIELPLLSHMGIKSDVESFMNEKNIHHSTSSVHVNFWCGEISKMRAIDHFLACEREDVKLKECVYFGDARNDQSCFLGFDHSVGVSNINAILDDLTHKPSIVLEGDDKIGPLGVYSFLSDALK
ncbi:MAG: HAD family phosphatase [Bacteriovoracaceae bacterium]|jgi:HAD superfamily hydrolase (TIGR01484 family)|nr:HAD family phosphatase [Bacteriovoracaceae bacterium]